MGFGLNTTSPLKLGIIGMSDGNGHPYSWSAIINGYDPAAMAECPFPAIPAYLGERQFPEDQLKGAHVTHIWTQDAALSAHIGRASLIPNVVTHPQEMVGQVDALLLARDDAENHLKLATPFLAAGLPVYLDKPVALSVADLDQLFTHARTAEQIFSCSALRFAHELRLTPAEVELVGRVVHVSGVTPKSWERYGVHVIDPILSFLEPGELVGAESEVKGKAVRVTTRWESGCTGDIRATGDSNGEISLTYIGERASLKKIFVDSFSAFREALRVFLEGVRLGRSYTEYAHLREVATLIAMGRNC